MKLQKIYHLLGLSVVLFGLTACMAGAMVLPAVPADGALTRSANHPAYKTANTTSFQDAAVLYLANNMQKSYHSIPVGDFLLSELLAKVPRNGSIQSLKLKKFDVKCGDGAVFAPKAICTIDAQFSLTQSGKNKLVNINDKFDAGGQFPAIMTDLSFKPDNNIMYIQEQVKSVVRFTASKFEKQL